MFQGTHWLAPHRNTDFYLEIGQTETIYPTRLNINRILPNNSLNNRKVPFYCPTLYELCKNIQLIQSEYNVLPGKMLVPYFYKTNHPLNMQFFSLFSLLCSPYTKGVRMESTQRCKTSLQDPRSKILLNVVNTMQTNVEFRNENILILWGL